MNRPIDTALDVIVRATEQAEKLGKTYGTLQEMLLTPIVEEYTDQCQKRGLIPGTETKQ